MGTTRSCDALIAGAGPAGLATALHLLRRTPGFRGRIVALEKSAHPRRKTCAGGLIPKTILALRELGIGLDVPHVAVMRSLARTPVGDALVERDEPVGTVVRRDEFDAMLAREARASGLQIEERCRVTGIRVAGGSVTVETERGEFEAPVVVGADGSGSIVRRMVFGSTKETLGRALMADIAVDSTVATEFVDRLYRFDFRCVSAGIHGYAWSFPCLVRGKPHLNVGIYHQYPRETEDGGGSNSILLGELEKAFPELPLEALRDRRFRYEAFPIRWFNRGDRYVRGRVVLAGDAAGVDPLMGEGISCAFEHGKLAARAIAQLLAGEPGALERYDRELHRGAIGWKLRKLAFAARHFYGPYNRMFFRMALVSRRAQEIGLDWYNGAGHTDEVATARLIARWFGSVLFGARVR